MSYWLDVIDLLSYVIISLVISISQKNWLSDKWLPLEILSG